MEHQSVQAIVSGAAASDEHFDRHVLGRMLLHAGQDAVARGQPVPDRLGVDGEEFVALCQYLRLDVASTDRAQRLAVPEEEEQMVRGLLVQNSSFGGPVGHWLAAILARRALEPNHLWEDLGLAARVDLSKLLMRHFFGLAEKNTRNMRWKKFLYRSLCEAEGFSMCPSPTCDACPEFDICYGDESGEFVLARNNKQARTAS